MESARGGGEAGGRRGAHLILLAVDRANGWAGAIASWTLLAMTLIVAFEVVSRYLFNRPTIWAWDVNTQLMLLLLMLGMAEAYRRDAHVRVDILTAHLSARQRAVLDIACAPIMFLVALVLVWTGWSYFLDSYQRLETASTLFGPPLYPIKFTLPLGGVLLLLQASVKLVRDLSLALGAVRTGGGPSSP